MNDGHPDHEIAVLKERFSRLCQASLRISENLEFGAVLQEVVDSARSLTDADYGVIAITDYARYGQPFLSSGTTQEEHQRLAEMPFRHQLFEHLARSGEPIRVEDFGSHTDQFQLPEFRVLTVQAFLGAPIRHHGSLAGHIYLAKKAAGSSFTTQDEEILMMFCAQAALVIANARKYWDEQRARNDLESLVNMSPIGVLVFDTDTGRLSLANEEARRIAGTRHGAPQRLEEFIRSMSFRRPDGHDVALSDHPIAGTIRGGGSVRAEEVSLAQSDRSTVKALLNVGSIFAADGQAETTIATIQDITPLGDLERLRAEFLGMVSHELRTPLTSIKGSTHTLLTAFETLDPAELLQFIRIIDVQADLMRELIGNLLDIARIETGTLSVAPEPVSIARLVDDARNTFLNGAQQHRIEISLDPNLPPIMADRRRTVQVLNNLLANAVQHAGASPVIRITAELKNTHIALSVVDRGPGIEAEQLRQLFRKFYGSKLSEDGRTLGRTGLGLSICKGIVEAQGGRIWAESDGLGMGARFVFTVPVAAVTDFPDPVGAPATAVSNVGSELSAGRILVVDDDPHALRYARDALTDAGYAPIVTGDPDAVKDLIEANRPHLVLMDLMLPGPDGIELMQGILQMRDIPVIFLSAYGQDDFVARAFESGAADYVVKPFSPTELVARIRSALRRWTGAATAQPVEPYVLGNLTINYDERKVFLAGWPVELTALEYDVLSQLATNYERPMTHDQLLHRVWGLGHTGDARLVRTVVTRLRRKLRDDASNPAYIFTQPRVGYRMPQPDGLSSSA